MSQPITFDVHVDQNEYLPVDGLVMDAAVSVTSHGAAGTEHGPPTAAQVMMIDASGSMSGSRLAEAKKAIGVALDTLRDGVFFAIVAGRSDATMVYPPEPRMAPASADTRAQARAAVHDLQASNGTAIGTWLQLADQLLTATPADIKHGLLLTDGRNQHETPDQLRETLEGCQDHFVCDCRGVGGDWEAAPLLEIADVLLGSAAGLPEPSELAADFQAITEKTMGKAAADVALRLWLLPGARVRFLKQMYPRIVDLTDRGTPVQPRTTDYPTGQWGAEFHDFHLSLEVPAGAVDDRIRVAKVSMVAGDHESPTSAVLASWTDDAALSTRINDKVAHHTGQAELARETDEGLAELARGNTAAATAKLGRAIRLAEQTGNEDQQRALARMIDLHEGTARLRPDVAPVDAEMAAVGSRRTVRFRSSDRNDLLRVVIYLSNVDELGRVEAEVEKLVESAGWKVLHREDSGTGSWFRRLWVKVPPMVDHRLGSELVRRPEAEVTATMLQHIGPVVTALQPTRDAVIWIGAVLVTKVDGEVSARELTLEEQSWLTQKPHVLTAPKVLVSAFDPPNGLPPASHETDGVDEK